MYNWKIMCSNEENFNGLHSELSSCRGSYILEAVTLPDTCGNAVTNIEFRYYSENMISLLHHGTQLSYSGNDQVIAEWIQNGVADFRSFGELTDFLLRFRDDSGPSTDGNGGEDNPVPERPLMKYNKDSITVPDSTSKYIVVDKDTLRESVNSEIFGQEENVEKIVHLVCDHIGTKNKTRPLSVFLFGPTGIGKSAVVESLVNNINKQLEKNNQFAYRPIDCTQFQEHHDISRLIGSAPGYVGYDEPGVFSILEDNPNTVFVFEEIEKAASNITETIMQAMETGRQETNGKTLENGKQYYDLSHSVIFFTSNIEVEDKQPNLGFAADVSNVVPVIIEEATEGATDRNIARMIGRETKELKEKLAATGRFRREVIGRMNAVIRFNPIPSTAVVDIAAKCISDIAAKHHLLYITDLDETLLQEFINETAGEVEQFGVRSLRSEAQYYFSDALRSFSHSHSDYAHVRVSGRLEEILIEQSE